MNSSNERLHESTMDFAEKRKHDDIDLIAEVRLLLISNNLEIGPFDNNSFIFAGKDKIPTVQRFFLNRFWIIQLLNTGSNSQDIRFSLIPNGSIEDWLRLFKNDVLPFIIKHKLPIYL